MGEQITYSTSEAIEETSSGVKLSYYDKPAFEKLLKNKMDFNVISIFADMARVNTLYAIARAGSGHIGSSFSSMDIVSLLYLSLMEPEDRYFSSKGHDSPGLYAVQTAVDILPFEKIHSLRRLGGLPGHPDIHTPGAHTNTGSLGMGVSKAKGFLFADELLRKKQGRVFVLTGDGELQEGQFWESLVSAGNKYDDRLIVIIDHNKIQSDTFVSNVSDLGVLKDKITAFGFEVVDLDGHDLEKISDFILQKRSGKPKVIIANTIKGRGVSFMEHTAMGKDQEYYKYHSGAPSRNDYLNALTELSEKVDQRLQTNGFDELELTSVEVEPLMIMEGSERMIPAYSEAILIMAGKHPELVALDADLALDTGLIPFKASFPERFIECGIAEQDMVSQAGTMALSGLLPVVHSFACFLTARPNEQIYNVSTEASKVIYVGSLAGLLPAGPGHSHQALRDVSLMTSIPSMKVIEPLNAKQAQEALFWAVEQSSTSTYLRLTSIPYSNRPEYQNISNLVEGQGHLLREGSDAVVLTCGPIITSEVLVASEILEKLNINISVIGMPWLNNIDLDWYSANISDNRPLIIVENHFSHCGFGSWLISHLHISDVKLPERVKILGVNGVPQCGRNHEILQLNKLDSYSLSELIQNIVIAKNG